MKKTYSHPTTDVMQYNLHQAMLTTSVPVSETETDVQFSRDGFFDLEDEKAISDFFSY